MSDWWIVKHNFDYNIIQNEFESQDIQWLDNIGTNHGTKWCRISLSENTINYIEEFLGVSIITSEMYVWDYGEKKDLPMHIDTHEWNSGNWVAVAIPFIGDFHLEAFDKSREKKLDEVNYGPGDVLILNNRKYPHQGHVINETRVAFHCYLKTPNYDIEKTLEENLEIHKL